MKSGDTGWRRRPRVAICAHEVHAMRSRPSAKNATWPRAKDAAISPDQVDRGAQPRVVAVAGVFAPQRHTPHIGRHLERRGRRQRAVEQRATATARENR